jgi:hypothetical protein
MRCPTIFATVLLMAQPSTELAWSRPGAQGLENCAMASQAEVARRHGLRPGADASSRIYANPQWAAEADNLFDACVRR